MEYLDQDRRIELIDLIYDLISEVTKETKKIKKDLHITNIATSYHNKIVDIERIFKNNNKNINNSLTI